MNGSSNYRYLNRGNRWLDFQRVGLHLGADGALRLACLPRFLGAAPLPAPTTPTGPAGVVATPDGSIFWTNPLRHLLLRRDGCDHREACAPCIGGEGGLPTQLREPRGLVYHPGRKALLIADTGNHRVLLYDPSTYQLVGVWGQSLAEDQPKPSDAPGRFDRPTALAVDGDGNVYVVDEGNRRVQKFDLRGTLVPGFAEPVKAKAGAPSAVAVDDTGLVLILDTAAQTVSVFDSGGAFKAAFPLVPVAVPPLPPIQPMGLAVKDGSVYVGDIARSRIRKYTVDGSFVGEGSDELTIAGLTVDTADNLVVVGVDGSSPVLLSLTGGFVRRGFLWSQCSFTNPSGRPNPWHWLRARWADMQAGVHLQLFLRTTEPAHGGNFGSAPWDADVRDLSEFLGGASMAMQATSDLFTNLTVTSTSVTGNSTLPQSVRVASLDGVAVGDSVDVDGEIVRVESVDINAMTFSAVFQRTHVAPAPAKIPVWVRAPRDAAECLFPGTPGGSVWIGAELRGEGTATPTLFQMRLDFDHETYLQYLPRFYRDDPVSASFLARLLTLFEGRFDDVQQRIVSLAALFDAGGAPDVAVDPLGNMLGLAFPETWDSAQKRIAIRGAFASEGRRGTAAALLQTLRDRLGIVAQIEEPILHTAWWCLPEDGATADASDSVLGFTTRLASVEPQGAVVGATAVLDQSQLIEQSDYGAALFRDVAHRFCVWLYEGWSDEKTQAAVRALLDQEKPAHTTYGLGIMPAAMRVGFQARLGIDAVVAGPGSAAPTASFALAGALPGQVGAASKVGQTTRLGSKPGSSSTECPQS